LDRFARVDRFDCPGNKPSESAAKDKKENEHEDDAPRKPESGHDGGRLDILPRLTAARAGQRRRVEQRESKSDSEKFHLQIK